MAYVRVIASLESIIDMNANAFMNFMLLLYMSAFVMTVHVHVMSNYMPYLHHISCLYVRPKAMESAVPQELYKSTNQESIVREEVLP